MLEKLKESLETAVIIPLGKYHYFVHPLTDGIPRMDPEILKEVIDAIVGRANLECDYIMAPEAMGIPLAVGTSLRTGIPYNIVRKRKYSLPGEVSIGQLTAYANSQMFIEGVKKGDRVVVLDDVLSTGGTLGTLIEALQGIGAQVVDVLVVVEKGDGKRELESRLGLRIKTLIKVEVKEGRLRVVN